MKTQLCVSGVFSRQVSLEPIVALPGHFCLQFESLLASAGDPKSVQRSFEASLERGDVEKLRDVLNAALAAGQICADERPESEINTLYVNSDYCDEVTLNCTMDDDIDSFGDLTWREFIEDYRSENLSEHQDCLDEWLDADYGITPNQLDENLDKAAIDRYYTDLSFRQDNVTGANAEAFELIRSLELFPMDRDGNGSFHGVTLDQSTANGPRKSVWIEDRESADWLIQQAAKRGVVLNVVFK